MGVLHFSPPLFITPSSVLFFYSELPCSFWNMEGYASRIFILHFPNCLFKAEVLPLHFYLNDGSIPEHKFLLVKNVKRFGLELTLGFYLNYIPENDMSSIMYIYIFLTMKHEIHRVLLY